MTIAAIGASALVTGLTLLVFRSRLCRRRRRRCAAVSVATAALAKGVRAECVRLLDERRIELVEGLDSWMVVYERVPGAGSDADPLHDATVRPDADADVDVGGAGGVETTPSLPTRRGGFWDIEKLTEKRNDDLKRIWAEVEASALAQAANTDSDAGTDADADAVARCLAEEAASALIAKWRGPTCKPRRPHAAAAAASAAEAKAEAVAAAKMGLQNMRAHARARPHTRPADPAVLLLRVEARGGDDGLRVLASVGGADFEVAHWAAIGDPVRFEDAHLVQACTLLTKQQWCMDHFYRIVFKAGAAPG